MSQIPHYEQRFTVAFYLSKFGVSEPPEELECETWVEAFALFFNSLSGDQDFDTFSSSLRLIRDHLDSHFDNGRKGFASKQHTTTRNQERFIRLDTKSREEIWNIVEPLIDRDTASIMLERRKLVVEEPEGNAIVIDHLVDLFIGEELKKALQRSILRKKNIILQGPPGTGKTFIAKRLARHLGGSTDDGSIEMVQFHQSFGYEDFVMGYRPGEDGFESHEGIFPEFCRRAEGDPDTPHFLIIDEINRGNLSRILGELMVLIEHDKRGQEHALRLGRSEGPEDRFHVPENLHIIGTMNTADRSLGRVDYALRRRFHFHSIPPCFDASMRDHLIDLGCPAGLASHVTREMTAMNDSIADPEGDLGPGFEIGHSYFCDAPEDEDWNRWLADIIELELIPLLREYWYDKPAGDTEKFVDDLRNHRG